MYSSQASLPHLVVDQNTKVSKKRVRKADKPSEMSDPNEVKVVKIDYDGEIPQDEVEEEGRVEQISIFDDMGD